MPTFNDRRRQDDDMGLADAKRLNATLRKLHAKQVMDAATLKEMHGRLSEDRFKEMDLRSDHVCEELLAAASPCAV